MPSGMSAVGSAPAAAKPAARPAPQQALLSGGQAAGPQSNKTKETALRSACRIDYMAHCSKVNPKGSVALSCLQRNAAWLSAKCRMAVAAVGGRPAGAALPPGAAVPAGAQPAALAPAPAPEANVAAVEAVSGHVVAFARGKPALLQNADIISDRTQLDLKPNSELRICHYRANQLLTLRGPARVSVSADGVMYEGGGAVDAAAGTCVPPGASRYGNAACQPRLEFRVPLRTPSSSTASAERVWQITDLTQYRHLTQPRVECSSTAGRPAFLSAARRAARSRSKREEAMQGKSSSCCIFCA